MRHAIGESFVADVYACHDGTPVPDALVVNARAVDTALRALRRSLEARHQRPLEVYVVSGYRTPEYNRQVHGEEHSYHLHAMAADIQVDGLEPEQVAKVVDVLQRSRAMRAGGLGRYDTFTHVDVRGQIARWDLRKRP